MPAGLYIGVPACTVTLENVGARMEAFLMEHLSGRRGEACKTMRTTPQSARARAMRVRRTHGIGQ